MVSKNLHTLNNLSVGLTRAIFHVLCDSLLLIGNADDKPTADEERAQRHLSSLFALFTFLFLHFYKCSYICIMQHNTQTIGEKSERQLALSSLRYKKDCDL